MVSTALIVVLSCCLPIALFSFIFALWRFKFRETRQNVLPITVEAVEDSKEEDPPEYAEFGKLPSVVGEVGTIRSDGTRSFLNGWFALGDTMGTRHSQSTTQSLPQPNAHQRLQSRDEEWDVDSVELEAKS